MKKILVIEPTTSFRQFFTSMFAERDHSLILVADGRTALNHFRRDNFNLVITELFVPEMDGLEIIREIRHTDPETPIVATTTVADPYREVYLRAAQDMGATLAISKPFSDADVALIFSTFLN